MDGPPVRCIDCKWMKGKCGRVRVNKYARKPCDDYCQDIARISRMNKMRRENMERRQPNTYDMRDDPRLEKIGDNVYINTPSSQPVPPPQAEHPRR